MKCNALVCVAGWFLLLTGAAAADEPEVGPPPQPYPGAPTTAGPALPGTTVPLAPECGPRPDFSRMPDFPCDTAPRAGGRGEYGAGPGAGPVRRPHRHPRRAA